MLYFITGWNEENTSKYWYFSQACTDGNFEYVSECLKDNFIYENAGAKNCKALINAAEYGHLEIVKLLMPIPNVRLQAQNGGGENALMFAVSRKHFDIAMYLLGFDEIRDHTSIDIVEFILREGFSEGNLEFVKHLIKIFNVTNEVLSKLIHFRSYNAASFLLGFANVRQSLEALPAREFMRWYKNVLSSLYKENLIRKDCGEEWLSTPTPAEIHIAAVFRDLSERHGFVWENFNHIEQQAMVITRPVNCSMLAGLMDVLDTSESAQFLVHADVATPSSGSSSSSSSSHVEDDSESDNEFLLERPSQRRRGVLSWLGRRLCRGDDSDQDNDLSGNVLRTGKLPRPQ